MRDSAVRIIGIDPGLRRTGWGIIEIGRRAARLRGERARDVRSQGAAIIPAARALRGHRERDRGLQAGRGGGRGDVRQRQSARDAEARSGARDRAAGAGDEGAARSRNIRRT